MRSAPSAGATARRCLERRSSATAQTRRGGTPTSPLHPSTPSPLRPRPAFALVDVIAAAILLGVALAMAIGLISRAISSQQLGEELQIAAMLADEQLNLVLARGPDDYGKEFPTDGVCDAPFERFTYALSISGGSESSPYTVAATITWGGGAADAGERDRSITIETLMSSRLGDDPDPDRLPVEPIQRY